MVVIKQLIIITVITCVSDVSVIGTNKEHIFTTIA